MEDDKRGPLGTTGGNDAGQGDPQRLSVAIWETQGDQAAIGKC